MHAESDLMSQINPRSRIFVVSELPGTNVIHLLPCQCIWTHHEHRSTLNVIKRNMKLYLICQLLCQKLSNDTFSEEGCFHITWGRERGKFTIILFCCVCSPSKQMARFWGIISVDGLNAEVQLADYSPSSRSSLFWKDFCPGSGTGEWRPGADLSAASWLKALSPHGEDFWAGRFGTVTSHCDPFLVPWVWWTVSSTKHNSSFIL